MLPWLRSFRKDMVSAWRSGGCNPPRTVRSGRAVAVAVAVAQRGGFAVVVAPWLNSSSFARPVEGRRRGGLGPDESSTRMERDRVKRFANRCLFFFGAADSRSVATFLVLVCCELLLPESPSVDYSVRYDPYMWRGKLTSPFVSIRMSKCP